MKNPCCKLSAYNICKKKNIKFTEYSTRNDIVSYKLQLDSSSIATCLQKGRLLLQHLKNRKKSIQNIVITNYSTHRDTVATCIVHPLEVKKRNWENKINTRGDSEQQITTRQ
jgi:hypothetical protein